jgi:glutaredoxin
MDTAILTLSKAAMVISNPYKFLFSGFIALIAWQLISRNTRISNQISSARKRLIFLYKKDIFEWLLNQERTIEYLDDKFTEVHSTNGSDVITVFVNPKCKYCKKVLETIPKLTAHFKLRIVSIATDNSEIIEYCRRNQISKTPTIVFNNKILPEIFQVEDLEYVI